MDLPAGKPLLGHPVNVVFIGSCTNSRISDLRTAAQLLKGRKVHPSVRVMVVPGSQEVKAQAQAEGLDQIFRDAGAEWREAGCSMCIAMNGDQLQPGRIQRLHQQSQFRRPAGQGRADVPGQPADCGRVRGHRRGHRREEDAAMNKFTPFESRLVPLADRQHRHRPDHPGAVPEDHFERGPGRPAFLRLALRRRGQAEAGFHPEHSREAKARADSAGGRQLRLRQFARARALGADAVRIPRGDQHLVRRHLQAEFAEEFAAADRGAARRPRRAVRESGRDGESGSGVADADAPGRPQRSSFRWTASRSTACSKASTSWATSCSRNRRSRRLNRHTLRRSTRVGQPILAAAAFRRHGF